MSRAAAALAVCLASGAAAETLRCAPALPNYCANVHVGCAGRSRLSTAPFTIVFSAAAARVEPDGGDVWRGRVSDDGRARVLRPAIGRDWIRIDDAGRYAERIHREGEALMTYGVCAPPR